MQDRTTETGALDNPDACAASGEGRPGLGLFGLAIWCGFVVGLMELGIVLARKYWPATAHSTVGMSRHFPWMVPASSLILFATCGLFLAALARVRPRWAMTVGPHVLLFQASMALLLTIPAFNTVACALLSGGIAYRGVPWATQAPRGRWLGGAVRKTFPLLAAVGLGLFAFCFGAEWWAERHALSRLPVAPRAAPNVLLIVMDTVRADHLSAFGYSRATSPNLSRLARRGARFDRATATAPWTLPSHSSLFTGCWPHQLGTGHAKPLDANVRTLAEALASRGYSTAGIIANHFFCSYEYGLDRGFAHYEDYEVSPATVFSASSLGWLIVQSTAKVQAQLIRWLDATAPASSLLDFHRKDAARINRDALRWLSKNRERPFFLFLNYFDAHDPYLLPSGQTKHFGLSPTSPADAAMLRDWHTLDKSKLSPRAITLAGDSYDDCIAYLDDQLGRLFDELDRRRLLDNTVVIVTSDHGEHLGEHQLFGHGLSLYQPELHVPLLIVYPPTVPQGLDIQEPVSLRDVPATIADFVGTGNTPPFPGSSLAHFWAREQQPAASTRPVILSEVESIGLIPAANGHSPSAEGPLQALTTAQEIYIHHDVGREELYDPDRDPGELNNLADQSKFELILKQLRESLGSLLHERKPCGGASAVNSNITTAPSPFPHS
ncbi:MAG: sulfatase [Isosphaeraceae bacterium]|nr:sulfatase [Isosphaeraceae bacterium]